MALVIRRDRCIHVHLKQESAIVLTDKEELFAFLLVIHVSMLFAVTDVFERQMNFVFCNNSFKRT